MPKRAGLTLSKRTVDGLSAEGGDTVFWDRDVPGFGIRVYPSGRKIYVVQARGPDGVKRVSLGRHGDLTPDRARRRAVATIGRIKRGEDAKPAPREAVLTVADLAERYMEAHVRVNCNAHTRGIYRGSLKNHILPALGTKAVSQVSREDAAALHYRLRATPRAANRALMVLSKMFSLAEAWGAAPPGSNPCRFVVRYREGRRERFLSAEEYRRVGLALRRLEARGPVAARAAAALRLAMLTGCRSGEVLKLQVGRRRPQGRRAAAARCEDGAADGGSDPRGAAGAGRGAPGLALALGVSGRQAEAAAVGAHRILAHGARGSRGGGRADPRHASLLRLAARWRWARACR